MKKFLAIIFLTVFAFQILPVKAIGKILWDNSMTEEVHEHGPCHKKMAATHHDKFWYLQFFSTPAIENEPVVCFKHALRDEALINCVHLEVPLQPPNVV
jgi:hypothetical protein